MYYYAFFCQTGKCGARKNPRAAKIVYSYIAYITNKAFQIYFRRESSRFHAEKCLYKSIILLCVFLYDSVHLFHTPYHIFRKRELATASYEIVFRIRYRKILVAV